MQERGLDRVADLSILPEACDNTYSSYNEVLLDCAKRGDANYKRVEINDIWEKFTVNFTVFHPINNVNELMTIHGTDHQLGNWNGLSYNEVRNKGQFTLLRTPRYGDDRQPIRMIRSEKSYDWLKEKYGTTMRPWQCSVTLDNTTG